MYVTIGKQLNAYMVDLVFFDNFSILRTVRKREGHFVKEVHIYIAFNYRVDTKSQTVFSTANTQCKAFIYFCCEGSKNS